MPLCIKGQFYAKAVTVYIMTAFYATGFGVESPCEESWPPSQKLLIHKGKILHQGAKLVRLPLMCLIDRTGLAPSRSQYYWKIRWHKIFPLCSLHKLKEKVYASRLL